MRQLLFCATLTEFCAIVALFFTQQLHRGNECNKKQAPEGLCNNVTFLDHSLSVSEHVPGILVADLLNDVLKDAFIVRESAALDFGTKIITEDPSEVFMSRVGQEAPGISEHSHEAGKRALGAERLQMFFHA